MKLHKIFLKLPETLFQMSHQASIPLYSIIQVRDVQFFLVDRFENSRKDRARPFFYHFTTAVDTENIRRVFRDVRETILEQNLATLMMQ